jgi:integrase
LHDFARNHLVAKAKAGKTTDRWLEQTEVYLQRAVDHFGGGRDLASIGVEDVRNWSEQLATTASYKGGTLSGGTVRHHLNMLSNLYRRAAGEGYVPPGYNPIMAMMEKPTARKQEACWLEVHHAALLLEAARTVALTRPDLAIPFLYPLLATFLLTGARRAEVLGLEVGDVSFDRRTVTFRVHDHRRLKTEGSGRVVPLWPELEEILRPYVFSLDHPPTRLLFPARHTQERMVGNFDKVLDQLAVRAGWTAGEIRTKMFRHTYCAARLQTLDQGAPVSPYTVGRELGHGGDALVRRVYGHLGQIRHRSEVVEYRVEQHADVLKDRLAALTFDTILDTSARPEIPGSA